MTTTKLVMLTTGNQLRAARTLVDMSQVTLADKASVNVNTVRNMEKKGAGRLTSWLWLETVLAVQGALERAGVEFTNGGKPGVRLSA